MLIIPLITQSRPLAGAPAPVLDNQRRPTVDTRGQQQAVGQFANATKQPELPDSLAEPDSALGAIGRAVSQAGDVMGALAIKQREAEVYVQVSKANSAIQVKDQEEETWRAQNPDPEGWVAHYQATMRPFMAQLTSDDKLHPDAREQIAMRAELEINKGAAALNTLAAKTTFQKAQNAVLGEIANGIESQDKATVAASIKKGRDAGWLEDYHETDAWQRFAKQGEQMKVKAEAEAYDNAQNIAITLATANGQESALKELRKGAEGMFGEFAPSDRARLEGVIRSEANNQEGELMDRLANGIAAGELNSPAKIKDAIGDSAHASPMLQMKAELMMERQAAREAKVITPEEATRNAVRLGHAADKYDRSQDLDGSQYFDLKAELAATVPSDRRGEIANVLDAKYGRRTVEDKTRPEIRRQITRSLNAMFDPRQGPYAYEHKEIITVKHKTDEGRWLGADRFKKGDPVIDPETKQPRVALDSDGNPRKSDWVIDPVAQQRANEAQARVEIGLDNWAKENPKDAENPKKIQEKMNELLPAGTRAIHLQGIIDQSRGKQGAAASNGKVTSYGYGADEYADSASAAGIGAFVPDSEAAKIKAGQESNFKLRAGDLAVSPDIEKAFRGAGVEPGGSVMVELANGEVRQVRWMDRTAQDSDIAAGKIKGVDKPLRGRWDFYSPGGKHPNDGMAVVRWWKAGEVASR